MKYEIVEEKERFYYGLSEVIDLNSDNNTPFPEIWDKSAKMFDMKYFNSDHGCIGLELYPYNFMEIRQFTYSAMFPVNKTEGLDTKYLYKLDAGKYIRFETTFGALVKGYVKQVYKFIHDNKLPVSYEFDYEEYPYDFTRDNINSKVYVVLKYEG